MDNYEAWNRFVSTGKITDYLTYKQLCATTYNAVGDLSNNADKDRWNRDKTTEN